MKKNLLATSALVAAGALFSTAALAEAKPIEIKVGGYYEQWVGAIFQDSDVNTSRYADDLDVQEDGEIHFKGSTTLDNGLTFGVNVQLEAATSGDQIDESYLFVRGSFGEIVLGSENGPAYAMHYGTDIDKGYGLEEGDTSFYWFSGGSQNTMHTSRLTDIDNDGQKIRWISPRMSGFQIGLSYTPEGRQDLDGRVPNEAQNGGIYEQIIAGAVNFDQKFDDVRVRVSAGGQFVSDHNGAASGGEDSVWGTALGLRIGAGGFEGTVAWGHQNGVAVSTTIAAKTIDTITAGVAYTDGPMGVSLTGAYGTTDGGTSGRDLSQITLQLGVGYKVGPGVSINGTAVYVNSDDVVASGADFTGFGVVGGVKLSF
jgi:outer membrane protein OmpU